MDCHPWNSPTAVTRRSPKGVVATELEIVPGPSARASTPEHAGSLARPASVSAIAASDNVVRTTLRYS